MKESEKSIKKESQIVDVIDDSPFRIVKMDERYRATIGNYLVTDGWESKEALIKYINSKPWNLIITATRIWIDMTDSFLRQRESAELEETHARAHKIDAHTHAE